MAVSIIGIAEDAYTLDIDGVVSSVPRTILNSDYQRLFGWGMSCVDMRKNVYNAFPSWVLKRDNRLVFIYSSGAGHANSDRQIWVKITLNADTTDLGDFANVQTGTFYENSGPGAGFQDLSFLDDMLDVGGVWAAKNIFKVRRTSGGYETSIQSTVAVTGQGSDNGTYALWTAQPVATDGKLYCTGYRTSTTPWVTALFESIDGGWTWTFTAIIASDPSLQFNEAAILKCANGDMIAVIREDSGAGRPLYLSRCTSGVTSWSTPVLLAGIQGTQPSLTLLPDGDVVLTVGHRTGSSGMSNVGVPNAGRNVTGIRAYRSANHGVTWPNDTVLATMWSTDGGQPMPVLIDGPIALIPCYLAPFATNGDSGMETGVYIVRANLNNISG